MTSRSKVVDLGRPTNPKMRLKLGSLGLGPRQVAEAIKDAHLIEAAQAADRIVISFDTTARSLFRKLSDEVAWVGEIGWVNPEEDPDEVREWLQRGATKSFRKIKTAPISRGRD